MAQIEAIPSEFKPTVALNSMSIIRRDGSQLAILQNTLQMSTAYLSGVAVGLGVTIDLEMMNPNTTIGREIVDGKIALPQDISMTSVSATTENSWKDVLASKDRKTVAGYYYTFVPNQFESIPVVKKTAETLEAQNSTPILVRNYSVDMKTAIKFQVSQGRDFRLKNSVVYPYPDHLKEDNAIDRNSDVADQARQLGKWVEWNEHDGMILDIGDVAAGKIVDKSNIRSFVQSAVETSILVKGGSVGLVQALSFRPERSADLGINENIAKMSRVLDIIADTGWSGPILVAAGNWDANLRSIELIHSKFPQTRNRS